MNNTEKAIVFIDSLDQSKKEIKMIKEATLKQLALKAEYADYEIYGTAFICPRCNKILYGYKQNYCNHCGQKLKYL